MDEEVQTGQQLRQVVAEAAQPDLPRQPGGADRSLQGGRLRALAKKQHP